MIEWKAVIRFTFAVLLVIVCGSAGLYMLGYEFPHCVFRSTSPNGKYLCTVTDYDWNKHQCTYRVEVFGLPRGRPRGGTPQLLYYNDSAAASFDCKWDNERLTLWVDGAGGRLQYVAEFEREDVWWSKPKIIENANKYVGRVVDPPFFEQRGNRHRFPKD
jgi:hypothetical protein